MWHRQQLSSRNMTRPRPRLQTVPRTTSTKYHEWVFFRKPADKMTCVNPKRSQRKKSIPPTDKERWQLAREHYDLNHGIQTTPTTTPTSQQQPRQRQSVRCSFRSSLCYCVQKLIIFGVLTVGDMYIFGVHVYICFYWEMYVFYTLHGCSGIL